METADIREASARVIAALIAAGRSTTTIKRHKAEFNAFAGFLKARGLALPTEAECLDFVAERSGSRLTGLREPTSSRHAQLARRLLILLMECLVGRETLDEAEARDLAGFWARRQRRGFAPKTTGSLRSALADFLRHLRKAGQIRVDLAGRLPPQRYPRRGESAPHPWTAKDVRLVLDQIDRQSAIGKRDYAMILLTARLGLRVGDLRRLELGWFDWRARNLALTQHKTGLPLALPLPGDVGWAVIDYIRHGRPEAGCPQVFVKHRYPFTAFGSSTSAGCRLGYYARRAGIAFPAGRSHGLHSLRGALAVAMLQTGTPPPVVAAVLGSRGCQYNRRALPQARHRAPAPLRPRRRRCPRRRAGGAAVNAPTLPGLIDTLVAARHAGGFRYNSQERVLRQFAGHSRREGYADGSIVQEAVEEFLYGRHLKASTIRREEIVLRELAEHARQFGWQAWAPPTLTRVKTPRRPPPYVFSDDEIRRLFHVIDTQPLSEMSNRALVDPVLFRVFYTTGMRLSEALNLELRDFDPAHATIEVRDGKDHEKRFLPVTGRLAATLETYIAAAHPHPGSAHKLFHTGDPSKPAGKSTVYNRFRRYLADADIPHFPGGPHIHSLRHGFAVQNLRRWAAGGADLVVMLPYLSAYMGHADLRGTQYYLQLTADAYPEVAAMAAARFGYVIPNPVALQGPQR
jgi:integrase/recombinase XerD